MTPHELAILLQLLTAIGKMESASSPNAADPPTFQIQQSLAETADTVLRCYHRTAKYQAVQVVEAPWSQQRQWNATASALLRIYWRGAFLKNEYVTVVGIVERTGQVRAVLLSDSAVVPPSNQCALDSWVTVVEPGQG